MHTCDAHEGTDYRDILKADLRWCGKTAEFTNQMTNYRDVPYAGLLALISQD
jgi:hypothetical protein